MRSRPVPIVILAFFHVLAPVANIGLSAWYANVSFVTYVQLLLAHHRYFDLMILGASSPVSGVAIYAVKRWSYPVYFLVAAVQIGFSIVTWLGVRDHSWIPILVATQLVNLGIVGYFLRAAVRAPYFDPKLRWWEQKLRYRTSIGAVLIPEKNEPGQNLRCKIVNFSEGGVLLQSERNLSAGDRVKVVFNHLGFSVELDGRVVHARKSDEWAYGVQFDLATMGRKQRKTVLALIRTLERSGASTLWERPSFARDLKNWYKAA